MIKRIEHFIESNVMDNRISGKLECRVLGYSFYVESESNTDIPVRGSYTVNGSTKEIEVHYQFKGAVTIENGYLSVEYKFWSEEL